jgi:Lrp/AsnC family transcriptional regulator, leucine-responsive regulatory protein
VNELDIKILSEVQRDSSRSIAELGEVVGLSSSACHRRQRALEESGVITGYGAVIDPAKAGIGVHALIDITLDNQSRACMERFEAAVLQYDDILECHLVSGEADYRLRVAARDLADFDDIHRRYLAELPGVSSMHTSFVLRQIKRWRGYALQRRI